MVWAGYVLWMSLAAEIVDSHKTGWDLVWIVKGRSLRMEPCVFSTRDWLRERKKETAKESEKEWLFR